MDPFDMNPTTFMYQPKDTYSHFQNSLIITFTSTKPSNSLIFWEEANTKH